MYSFTMANQTQRQKASLRRKRSRSERRCRFCGSPLNPRARLCKECGKYRRGHLLRSLAKSLITPIAIVVMSGLVVNYLSLSGKRIEVIRFNSWDKSVLINLSDKGVFLLEAHVLAQVHLGNKNTVYRDTVRIEQILPPNRITDTVRINGFRYKVFDQENPRIRNYISWPASFDSTYRVFPAETRILYYAQTLFSGSKKTSISFPCSVVVKGAEQAK